MKRLKILLVLIFSLFVTENLPQDAEAATSKLIKGASSSSRVLKGFVIPEIRGVVKSSFTTHVITTSKFPSKFLSFQSPNLLRNFSTTLISYAAQTTPITPYTSGPIGIVQNRAQTTIAPLIIDTTALVQREVQNTTALIPYQIQSEVTNSFKAFGVTTSVQDRSWHRNYSLYQGNGIYVQKRFFSTKVPSGSNSNLSNEFHKALKKIFPEVSEEELNKFLIQALDTKKHLKKIFPEVSEKEWNKFLIQVISFKKDFPKASEEEWNKFLIQVMEDGLELEKNNFNSYKQKIKAFLKYVDSHASKLNELWPKDSEIGIVEFFKQQIMSNAETLKQLYSNVSQKAIGSFATQVVPKIHYLYFFSDKGENLIQNFCTFFLSLQELKVDQKKIEQKIKDLIDLIIKTKSSGSWNAAELKKVEEFFKGFSTGWEKVYKVYSIEDNMEKEDIGNLRFWISIFEGLINININTHVNILGVLLLLQEEEHAILVLSGLTPLLGYERDETFEVKKIFHDIPGLPKISEIIDVPTLLGVDRDFMCFICSLARQKGSPKSNDRKSYNNMKSALENERRNNTLLDTTLTAFEIIFGKQNNNKESVNNADDLKKIFNDYGHFLDKKCDKYFKERMKDLLKILSFCRICVDVIGSESEGIEAISQKLQAITPNINSIIKFLRNEMSPLDLIKTLCSFSKDENHVELGKFIDAIVDLFHTEKVLITILLYDKEKIPLTDETEEINHLYTDLQKAIRDFRDKKDIKLIIDSMKANKNHEHPTTIVSYYKVCSTCVFYVNKLIKLFNKLFHICEGS